MIKSPRAAFYFLCYFVPAMIATNRFWIALLVGFAGFTLVEIDCWLCQISGELKKLNEK